MQANRAAGVVVAIAATAALGFGIAYTVYLHPEAAAGQAQPIPFSHRLHATVKDIDCRFCHNTVDRSPWAGIPSVEKCLFCHEHIIPKHPVIVKLAGFRARGEAIPWVKVTDLPDHVYFPHDRHMARGVDCRECHGEVERMDRVKPAHELTMGFCLECHRARGASTDCWACHG